MATSNVPRHDFAPAWLKIPSQDNLKSAASCKQSGQNDKSGRLKKDDSSGNISGSHSHNSSSSRYNSDYSKLHRQHSFENYQENKRYLSNQPKYRHHSVDDDYYSYPYGHYNNYYNGYNTGYDKYNMQYGSQPSLLRPPSRQEAVKYQHPNSRFPNQVPGYQNYYDVYPQDYHHGGGGGDPYYNNPYPTRPVNGRKNLYERENRLSNPKNEVDCKDREYVERSNKEFSKDRNVFNDEFPSLNGRNEVYHNDSNYLSTNGNGVWDNPLPSKSGNYYSKNEINFVDYQGPRDNDRSRAGNGIYRFMTPNKSSSPCPTDNRNYTTVANQPETSTDRETLKDATDLNLEDNSSQRRLSGKQGNQVFGCNSPEELVNGVDLLSVKDNGRSFLSSSLEAEQRLLRQMGWTETEEDEYVITEDDKKEFQKLTNQVKQQQQRNGLVRPLPKTWSPKHIPVYQPNAQELNEVFSSDSDSEDSC